MLGWCPIPCSRIIVPLVGRCDYLTWAGLSQNDIFDRKQNLWCGTWSFELIIYQVRAGYGISVYMVMHDVVQSMNRTLCFAIMMKLSLWVICIHLHAFSDLPKGHGDKGLMGNS